MFGKRQPSNPAPRPDAAAPLRPGEPAKRSALPSDAVAIGPAAGFKRSDRFYEVKKSAFDALIESINLGELAKLAAPAARKEIRELTEEILRLGPSVLSAAEREDMLDEICNDVLGFGPIEPLLAEDGITDIMINGARDCYIELDGRVIPAPIAFADNEQLANICQRIANRVGRRVDESTPICDARLPDGSRVNIIFPPLALNGPTLTVRKFRRDRLTLDQLVTLGAVSAEACGLLEIISRCRCNVLISGGTGSGKTTLLNCLTGHIAPDERVITCEEDRKSVV